MNNSKISSVERLSQENLSDVERLHAAVYGKQPPKGLFAKKYDTAYTGIEHVGFIAYDHERVSAAFYGVIPCFISLNGYKVLTAQSADTMTHPAYRGLGLFTQLAEQTYELCEAFGIGFVFGFPNQNSLPGFVKKLGWEVTDTMERFTIPVRSLPIQKIANRFHFATGLYQRYKNKQLTRNKASHQPVNNPIIAEGFGGVLRDEPYLQYKAYSDTHVLSLGNAVAWVKINDSLFIGDLMNVDAHNFKETMRSIIKLARQLGLGNIHFHCCKGTSLYSFFSAEYIPAPSFPVIFKEMGTKLDFSRMKFTFADIDIF